jgi:hypothetical protein
MECPELFSLIGKSSKVSCVTSSRVVWVSMMKTKVNLAVVLCLFAWCQSSLTRVLKPNNEALTKKEEIPMSSSSGGELKNS